MTTSTADTWILVSVPSSRLLDRVAVRGGLGLLAWAGRPRRAAGRSVDLERVDRPASAPRPFC